jgi:uncharacterized protein YbjT (DUF2867 family)
MVRSFGFMSNTLRWVPQLAAGDLVRAPFAGVAVAMIDPYDIAAVAAAALTSGAHEGRVCTVSGPEPLRPADRPASWARCSAATCGSRASRTMRPGRR